MVHQKRDSMDLLIAASSTTKRELALPSGLYSLCSLTFKDKDKMKEEDHAELLFFFFFFFLHNRRAVLKIGNGCPSEISIKENCNGLARYAAICQVNTTLKKRRKSETNDWKKKKKRITALCPSSSLRCSWTETTISKLESRSPRRSLLTSTTPFSRPMSSSRDLSSRSTWSALVRAAPSPSPPSRSPKPLSSFSSAPSPLLSPLST